MPPSGSERPSPPTRDFDVVVVGGGGSGLAAAISAVNGLVAVVEKAPYLRGSTGRSIGSIAVSRTPEQRALGVNDSPVAGTGPGRSARDFPRGGPSPLLAPADAQRPSTS